MRLWSLHPRYLDPAGLTACWREALLAQKVLSGATRGYRRHPQLERFRAGSALAAGDTTGWPGDLIVAYLHALADEADHRGYCFDRDRIVGVRLPLGPVEVTDGQVAHEWGLLTAKLAARNPAALARWDAVVVPEPHPCFVVVSGPLAGWEVVSR